jgi:signal transduction histidine kinase
MSKKLPILRVAGPTILVSLLLFAVCLFAAVVLYRWHSRTAQHLTEDIDSRKVAVEMETTLRTLITLVGRGSDVESLHDGIAELLEKAKDLANTQAEEELGRQLEESFNRYLELWWEHGSGTRPNPALEQLQQHTLPLAVRIRAHHTEQIDKSEAALRETIKWLAWGLVGVGVVGSLGGIFFGYGVARAIRQSFYKLSVSIRDATDKLRHEFPTVTLQTGEGMDYLHEQMKDLMQEIEQTVERLQQREHEVLRAEQMAAVGQLAAGVAHELRNPLTAVKMLVQSSREDLAGRGLPAEDLQIIEKEIRRLESSLQTFLDFARPPRMERRAVNVSEVVEEALALISGRAKKQDVSVDFDPPAPEISLHADPDQLRQLLLNLIMNALDAMPQGGALTLRARLAKDNQLELQVRDTGPGVSAEVMPRLFEPFVSGKETGLGLGLVVSRRIAEAHGGSLTGENLPGQGACFTLRLPAAAGGQESGLTAQGKTHAESAAGG